MTVNLRSESKVDQSASTVYFNNTHHGVTTPAEAMELLRSLSDNSDVAHLAQVQKIDRTMTIGLALPGDRSVALFLSSDGRPFHGIDPSSTAEGENVCFELDGTNQEFDSGCVITLEQALRAVGEFVETGELTKDLLWRAEGMSTTL